MLVDNSSRVSFIDCDSYQVRSPGKIYICPVGILFFQCYITRIKLKREESNNEHNNF
jgi:DNA-binding helix-hairpin-helix protein with protein kinase domain